MGRFNVEKTYDAHIAHGDDVDIWKLKGLLSVGTLALDISTAPQSSATKHNFENTPTTVEDHEYSRSVSGRASTTSSSPSTYPQTGRKVQPNLRRALHPAPRHRLISAGGVPAAPPESPRSRRAPPGLLLLIRLVLLLDLRQVASPISLLPSSFSLLVSPLLLSPFTVLFTSPSQLV